MQVRATIVADSAEAIVLLTRWFIDHGEEHSLPVVRFKNKFANTVRLAFGGLSLGVWGSRLERQGLRVC
jgi:hypothetical protein